jgi:hypothetical protein
LSSAAKVILGAERKKQRECQGYCNKVLHELLRFEKHGFHGFLLSGYKILGKYVNILLFSRKMGALQHSKPPLHLKLFCFEALSFATVR